MGVEAGGGQILMACLIGACRMTGGDGREQLLQAGQSIWTVEGRPGEPSSIPPEAEANWNEICDGCLTDR